MAVGARSRQDGFGEMRNAPRPMRAGWAAPIACWAAGLDPRAARWGFGILATLAFFYYSLYWSHGLNLAGEGGTTAVLACRLLEGQRPLADTFLGYNILWFLPVTWIFQLTGPDYMALRIYFFGLSTVTALLGFAVVRRMTNSGLLALGTGLSLIMIPGMLFRNYMGLLGVGCQWAFTCAFLAPSPHAQRRVWALALSGLAVGITFLIRVEAGWLMLVVWVGLIALSFFAPGARRRWRELAAGAALGCVLMAAIHVPFAWDAARRGYWSQFWHQYSSFFSLIRWELSKLAQPSAPPNPTNQSAGSKTQTSFSTQTTIQSSTDPSANIAARRPRPDLHEIWQARRSRDRFFAAAVHVPVVLAAAVVGTGAGMLLLGWARKDEETWRVGLALGALTGCALTLFPQYFFFRPDTPHIVEFMAPFQVALACAAGLAFRAVQKRPTAGTIAAGALAGGSFVLMVWIHFGHGWKKESAGTIAARRAGSVEFRGLNNVRAWLPAERARELEKLRDVILAHSRPEDWVVCLPYSPTINFMTDRPSYLWDLYMDNTLASEAFEKEKIEEMRKYDPAVVVVDHRAVNKVEASRFRNWAPRLYHYIREHYDFAGEYAGNEVFVRRP